MAEFDKEQFKQLQELEEELADIRTRLEKLDARSLNEDQDILKEVDALKKRVTRAERQLAVLRAS